MKSCINAATTAIRNQLRTKLLRASFGQNFSEPAYHYFDENMLAKAHYGGHWNKYKY